ncbi:hypothetical protein AFUB_080830 [Aspergillus fumigatus A1163]|uniref:Uncharacterized protein n=1 Tax=Aspergillus fumigatus (strain CBS 144.89 / FGSC A1163 / CEA10) TaxID=451804 RepID=B0Y9F3_ASPFC|nr:hypothetical protein AFUB_080830 [Aspergillus fumigatus A1163]
MQDADRLCCVGKNLHSLKNRLWEGIVPLCEQRWKEKGLNKMDNFDVACQHLSAVCAAFEYLNQPTVMQYMRDTFNLIWEHWRELEVMLNRRRAEKQQPPVSVTGLWTAYMTAHFEVMTERAHRWVTVKVRDLRGPLLTTLRLHRPVDLDTLDRVQWRTTDALHELAEINCVADYGILIPMDGYKGYTAPALPSNIPRALRSTVWSERGEACAWRLKRLTRTARYESMMQARARGAWTRSMILTDRHFHGLGPSPLDAPDQINDRVFLVVDEPSVASYTSSSYSSALLTARDGDFAGFVLAVDAEWDPVEGPDRPDESPGYHGQMRILGSLVWGDLFAMYASQSALLEDLWPLALDHPNTVYVGPVVPDEIKDWRLQNGLRNVCLQAVADYAHKKIDGTPFPVAPVQTNPTRAARSGTGDAGPSSSPSHAPPGTAQGQEDNPLRSYLLRAFHRHLQRNNHYREAALVGEMLATPANQTVDMERVRQRMEQGRANPAPSMSREEEDELERQEFETEFCPQQ